MAAADLVAGGGASAAVRAAADTSWLDIESRIQYGYFTEDRHSLNNLRDQLAPGERPDRLKSYYDGLLAYRLTLLARKEPPAADSSNSPPGNPARSPAENRARIQLTDLLERCVADLDHALEAQKDFADALALQSACLGMLADLKPWRAPFAGPRSSTQIQKALQLAPRNPRVLLLDAIGDYERPKSPGGDADRALVKFKKAVAAFEAEREGLDQVPGWGAAEAYTFLARSYLDRGDAIAARDALERALLIAPEFLQARRLMTQITGGLS